MNSDKKINLYKGDNFQYQEIPFNGENLTNLYSNRIVSDRIIKTCSSQHLPIEAVEKELLKLKENIQANEKKYISTYDLPNVNLNKEPFNSEPKIVKHDNMLKDNQIPKIEVKRSTNARRATKFFRPNDVFGDDYCKKESFEKYKRKKSSAEIEEERNELVNFFLNKQKFYSSLITFFVLINLGLNMVDISLYVNSFNDSLDSFFKNNDKRIYSVKIIEDMRNRPIPTGEMLIRIINYCVILVIDICVFLQYKVEVDIAKYYRNCEDDESIVSFSIFKKMIIEMIVLSIFFPPDYLIITDFNEKRYVYPLNAFICVISTIKIYVMGNSIFHFSKWREQSNIVICKKYDVNPDLTFVNLAMFKQHLILFNMITFFISIFYLGFLLWCFDIGIFVSKDNVTYVKINDYDISTCIYLILQTCTTLGYGELVQSSYTGRFIAISSVIFGWVCLSLIIVFSFKKLDFDEDEVKSYYEYKKREIKEITEKKAINVIKMFIRFRYLLLVNKQKYNFLTDKGEKYQYETFLTLRRSKRKNSVNNTRLKKLIEKDKTNIYVLRFYNKIFGYNTLYSYVVDFTKSNRVLKCYLPTLEVKMQNFITAIDDNYKKLNFIIDSLETVSCELKEQVENSKESLSKLLEIEKIQTKIARILIKINNQNYCKKFGYSSNNDFPICKYSPSGNILQNM